MAKLINMAMRNNMAKIATWSVADKGIGIAVVGNGLNRQDAGANAEGGPEGVSARKARIIEPRGKAVRFPYEAECAVLLREFEVVESQWWPGTDCAGRMPERTPKAAPKG